MVTDPDKKPLFPGIEDIHDIVQRPLPPMTEEEIRRLELGSSAIHEPVPEVDDDNLGSLRMEPEIARRAFRLVKGETGLSDQQRTHLSEYKKKTTATLVNFNSAYDPKVRNDRLAISLTGGLQAAAEMVGSGQPDPQAYAELKLKQLRHFGDGFAVRRVQELAAGLDLAAKALEYVVYDDEHEATSLTRFEHFVHDICPTKAWEEPYQNYLADALENIYEALKILGAKDRKEAARIVQEIKEALIAKSQSPHK